MTRVESAVWLNMGAYGRTTEGDLARAVVLSCYILSCTFPIGGRQVCVARSM